jgi:KUP system potassium uptake protein
MAAKEKYHEGVIKSLGLVFGDIGTSPIYTLTVIFLTLQHSVENVIGIVSLIAWTLLILVFIEYVFLAMSLGKKGEGGVIVLMENLMPLLKSSRYVSFALIISLIGVSLLAGDGVITPAISILSAVEGILFVPGFEHTSTDTLVIIAAVIAFFLFAFQYKGPEKVAWTFGPVMVLWFACLGISGLIAVLSFPQITTALNPFYGIKFLLAHGLQGFFLLSEVMLCATGGEALYAHIGHLGKKPIVRAWNIVFIILLLNYMGQGAFLINNPDSKNILFEMILKQGVIPYVPFLLISIAATIIASQALITGMFALIHQGISIKLVPMLRVDYTSRKLATQIYIPSVNWFLFVFVIFIMFTFRQSANLAAAYGLAVTGTMTITGITMLLIFSLRKNRIGAILSLIVLFADVIFLVSNIYKIPHGGYWSLIIAAIPFTVLFIYLEGQKKLYSIIRPLEMHEFVEKYKEANDNSCRIKGTAIFFIKDLNKVQAYVPHTMFTDGIMYEHNIIVSIVTRNNPFGINGFFKDNLAEGLRTFEIGAGYMEVVDVGRIIKEAGIAESTIFYGVEDIMTNNPVWKVFSLIKKLAAPFVQFYKLPTNKLHGVVTRVEL